jgi:hypothetical protein
MEHLNSEDFVCNISYTLTVFSYEKLNDDDSYFIGPMIPTLWSPK